MNERNQSPEHLDDAQLVRKLDEVVQQLRLLARLQQHRDFSLIRLIGIVVQLAAVALIFWTAVGLLDLPKLDFVTMTTWKLLALVVLQLLALTCFVLDRQEH